MRRTPIALLACAALARAATLPSLPELAARSAEREIAALGAVACTETVWETKLSPKNKLEERRRRIFDYVALVDASDGDLSIVESRVEQGGPGKPEPQPLLASTGFATMMLLFHPYYQNSFDYTDLGSVEQDGRQWRRLGFRFRPGQRSPSLLRTGVREYPLAWRGEALVDTETGWVGSIQASLGAQLEEIGLEALEVRVRYGPAAGGGAEWLPLEAVIDLRTPHQHWRNLHTFGSYKHFAVTTTEKQAVK